MKDKTVRSGVESSFAVADAFSAFPLFRTGPHPVFAQRLRGNLRRLLISRVIEKSHSSFALLTPLLPYVPSSFLLLYFEFSLCRTGIGGDLTSRFSDLFSPFIMLKYETIALFSAANSHPPSTTLFHTPLSTRTSDSVLSE